MNIKGYEMLIELGFPVSRNTALFRTLDEIPAGHMDIYGDEPAWFMAGFDYENTRITEIPQNHRSVRALNVSRKNLKQVFEQLEGELQEMQIPKQSRKYLIWELHNSENTDFTGFGFNGSYEVMIDFFKGVRSSRKDSNPCFSVHVPKIGSPNLSCIPESAYRNSAIRIVKDLIALPDNMSVDFVQLKDGYLFYTDLWQTGIR